jgi:hypothetical protein
MRKESYQSDPGEKLSGPSTQESDVNESASKKRIYGVWAGSWPNSEPSGILEKSTPIDDSEVSPFSLAYRLHNLPQEEELKPTNTTEVEPQIQPVKSQKELLLEFTKTQFTKAGEKTEQPEPEAKPATKQHSGLRCKKCFVLLARDTDFEYRNGRIYINPALHKDKTWQGLVIQSGKVYCQNMHIVGLREQTSWTNQQVFVSILKTKKTTFIENFVNK